MGTNLPEIDSIFWAAVDISSAEERAAYLQYACGQDKEVLHRVKKLLDAHVRAGSFLEPPTATVERTIDGALQERPGTIIGPYKLLEQIGEGGFGVVFMAEQRHPIQRKVALKIIKPGMDTQQVIARFEAERQALALMDHPHIAKVLDAGATESGRPYFVMELVRGVSVTEYCDNRRLPIRERLELFITICQAVQHAHQKGIIHRDLKPMNVLVTLHDGRPVAKVIDFGVAKATGHKLTDKTLFTGFAQMVGTPMYMAPEQAEMSGLDVDTRSDIYSLGVLLYELLTGHTPFDSQRLKEVAFDEMRRIIREEEPPRPSTRLSTLAQQAISTVSENRACDARQLSRLFQGELDWIVMKTLDKDRNRRYETASDLAADVEHYLHNEPVQACPPSKIYRIRKFALRNRTSLITGLVVLAALVFGTIVSTWQAVRATIAEKQAIKSAQAASEATDAERKAKEDAVAQRKDAQKENRRSQAMFDFLVASFQSTDLSRDGHTITVAEVLDRSAKELQDRFGDDPGMKGTLLAVIGDSYAGLGLSSKAIPLLETAREMCTGALGPDESATILSTGYLANAYSHVERLDEAQRLGEEALKHWKAKLGPDDGRTLTAMDNLGHYYSQAGRINEAIPLLEETLNLKNAKFGPDNEQTATTMGNLANAYSEAGRHDDVLRLAEDALKISKSKLGLENIETIMQMSKLAKSYFLAGRIEEAISLDEAALKVAKAKLRPDDDSLLVYMNNLAEDYLQARRFADADVVVRELIRLEPDNAEWRLDHAIALNKQAVVGSKTSLWDEAAAEFVKAIDLSEDVQISGSMRRKVCCILASSDEVFERVLKLRPEERTLWIGRASDRARRCRWTEAEADYARVIHDWPIASDETVEYAYLLLVLGDVKGYQRFCQELMARHGEPQNVIEAFQMARAFAAGPSEVVEPTRLVEWARKGAESKTAPWYAHALGLAYYRAGNYERAIENLKKSNATNWSFGANAQNWLVLAMAHQRLGHVEEAKQCLETARQIIDQTKPKKPGDASTAVAPDWIPMQVLSREAESLLKEPPSEP